MWALPRFWRMVAIGCAYKAKVLCSIIFGTDRTIDPQRADDVSEDSYRLLRLFRARIDATQQSVTASFLGRRPRSAVYRAGLGATLTYSHESLLQLRTAAISEPRIERAATRGAVLSGPRIDTLVDAAFTEPQPKRLRRTRAIVVLRDGQIVAEKYASGFSDTTPLPGWSMTKSVVGALIGILVGEGRLTLHDKALLPHWQPPDPRAEINLEDLLRMRSGLKFTEAYSDFSSDVIEMLFNRPDAAAYAASQPLLAAPGTAWSYSSGTTNILSGIARRIIGEVDYLQWPRRALFDPIGMTSAVMEPDASGTFVGSSFMFATARDWARFGQLYLDDGMCEGVRIIPDGWVRFSTTATAQSPGGIYGGHWWLKLQPELGGASRAAEHIPADAFFAVGHEGQVLTIVPSLRLVVVRLGLSIYVDAWDHAAFLADLVDALAGRPGLQGGPFTAA